MYCGSIYIIRRYSSFAKILRTRPLCTEKKLHRSLLFNSLDLALVNIVNEITDFSLSVYETVENLYENLEKTSVKSM